MNENACRKYNFKSCMLCSKIVMNLSDHVRNTHKIESTHDMYNSYVRDPPVIPAVYTKILNGVRVKLEGEELEEAQERFSSDIRKQSNDIVKLKELRKNIDEYDRESLMLKISPIIEN